MVTVPLPQIEGFQPIPNAVMIPFMEAQSAALAYGFGLNYEYGKRKIRSMSNTEFNSLTSEDITNMSNNHTHIILSKFQLQVPAVMPMQKEIFNQYVIIEKAKVVQNIELAKWIVDYVATGSNQAIEQFFGNLFGSPKSSTTLTPTQIAKTVQQTTNTSVAGVGPKSVGPFSKQEQADRNQIQAAERALDAKILVMTSSRGWGDRSPGKQQAAIKSNTSNELRLLVALKANYGKKYGKHYF